MDEGERLREEIERLDDEVEQPRHPADGPLDPYFSLAAFAPGGLKLATSDEQTIWLWRIE